MTGRGSGFVCRRNRQKAQCIHLLTGLFIRTSSSRLIDIESFPATLLINYTVGLNCIVHPSSYLLDLIELKMMKDKTFTLFKWYFVVN